MNSPPVSEQSGHYRSLGARPVCLAIHFTWKPDWPSVRKVLPMIEQELAPFEVRPHWGKLFTVPSAPLQKRYEMCAEFKRLVAQYDPRGKFRNKFLAANLYG